MEPSTPIHFDRRDVMGAKANAFDAFFLIAETIHWWHRREQPTMEQVRRQVIDRLPDEALRHLLEAADHWPPRVANWRPSGDLAMRFERVAELLEAALDA